MPTAVQLAACRALGNGSRPFDDAHDEFVSHVRVRSAMARSLDEGQVLLLAAVDALRREALNLFGQQVRVVEHIHPVRRLADVNDRVIVLDQRPLERHLAAVHVEALAVLARRVEQVSASLRRRCRSSSS